MYVLYTTVLINADFQQIDFIHTISSNLPVIGQLFFNGKYDDLNRYWYPRVGFSFLILIISTIFSNMLSMASWELIRICKRTIIAKRKLLQADMNEQMLGGIFEVDSKYSYTLAMIFLVMLYFGPIPLMLPIVLCYFIIQFCMDKLFFLRFACRPPHFHEDLHLVMIRILPIAALFHCILSMWSYGTPQVWASGITSSTDSNGVVTYSANSRSFSERLFNSYSFPFFILFCILLFLYIFEGATEKLFLKCFGRCIYGNANHLIDLNQPCFSANKEKMSKFSEVSYDPSLNQIYKRVLEAMDDVAHVNQEVEFKNSISDDKKAENSNYVPPAPEREPKPNQKPDPKPDLKPAPKPVPEVLPIPEEQRKEEKKKNMEEDRKRREELEREMKRIEEERKEKEKRDKEEQKKKDLEKKRLEIRIWFIELYFIISSNPIISSGPEIVKKKEEENKKREKLNSERKLVEKMSREEGFRVERPRRLPKIEDRPFFIKKTQQK